MNADGTPSCSDDVSSYEHTGDAWIARRRPRMNAYVCIADFGDDANVALVTDRDGSAYVRLVTAGPLCRQLVGFTGS